MSKFGNINITLGERVSRIYTDLRLGIPVIIRAADEHLVVPVETLNQTRFDLFRSLETNLRLVVSSRRANTLNCLLYTSDAADDQ